MPPLLFHLPWYLRIPLTALMVAAWFGLLALPPWWLGLPLLLALALGAAILAHRRHDLALWCRRGLKWGLPAWLFALQRALGGDLVAWGAALLGALVGFSLVALLESLLDHRVHRTPRAAAQPEWRELAMAPVGPPAHIVELVPPRWREVDGAVTDPRGGQVIYRAIDAESGSYRFGAGRSFDRLSRRCSFSPAARWFVASAPGGRGDLLWDRDTDKVHRLRGWQLYGWDGEQPWLAHGVDGVPTSLHEALGTPRDTG
ncbi:MAG TPA: hypothetical protein VIM98_16535 [Dyella sp.]|uniref:hypothetical protein n=1 Tax=Dyella sp. TaxID=1869338 RepID=UPI002F928B43